MLKRWLEIFSEFKQLQEKNTSRRLVIWNEKNGKKLNEKINKSFTQWRESIILCKHAGPDIQNKISVFNDQSQRTRWRLLEENIHIILCLNDTKELVLTLSANGMKSLKCFVYASYATHTGMKSHMGSVMKTVKVIIT